MTLCTASGSLPAHQYVWIERRFVRPGDDVTGFEPAVWFGLHSHPGRAWGCHVMLECGAVYRGLPPHALAFSDAPAPWTIEQAQRWDCYGRQFALLQYEYLAGLEVRLWGGVAGDYLFTAVPIGDAFTAEPTQSKEFMFIRTAHDRLAIVPTNDLLFIERSFTVDQGWPTLRRQTEVYSCETDAEK